MVQLAPKNNHGNVQKQPMKYYPFIKFVGCLITLITEFSF